MNEILKAMEERRSCRSFLPEQLKESDLEQILRAGTFAATGMGRQSPKIVVLQKPEDIAALERMNAAVLGNPDSHPFYGAPTVCVVLAAADAFTNVEDGSLVMGNLMLVPGRRCLLDSPGKRGVCLPGGQGALEKMGRRG